MIPLRERKAKGSLPQRVTEKGLRCFMEMRSVGFKNDDVNYGYVNSANERLWKLTVNTRTEIEEKASKQRLRQQ
ncbi:hypothetical protein QYF36_011328 [Acer negundo]|nr:hypothetical protein QYF36_011328 [Acer negundo]